MKATIYDKHADAEPRFTRGVSQTGKRLVREVLEFRKDVSSCLSRRVVEWILHEIVKRDKEKLRTMLDFSK